MNKIDNQVLKIRIIKELKSVKNTESSLEAIQTILEKTNNDDLKKELLSLRNGGVSPNIKDTIYDLYKDIHKNYYDEETHNEQKQKGIELFLDEMFCEYKNIKYKGPKFKLN